MNVAWNESLTGARAGEADVGIEAAPGLAMRPSCEHCGVALDPSGGAFICSYECTRVYIGLQGRAPN